MGGSRLSSLEITTFMAVVSNASKLSKTSTLVCVFFLAPGCFYSVLVVAGCSRDYGHVVLQAESSE